MDMLAQNSILTRNHKIDNMNLSISISFNKFQQRMVLVAPRSCWMRMYGPMKRLLNWKNTFTLIDHVE
jgi:hypothetical protein